MATLKAPADNPANGAFFNAFCDAEGVWGRVINGFRQQIVPMTLDRFVDGPSNTILFGERRYANLGWHYLPSDRSYDAYAEVQLGMVWWANSPDPSTPATNWWRIQGDGPLLDGQSELVGAGINFARPASWHSGGAQFLMGDNAVRFIGSQIDYGVFCQLMSSNGAGTSPPAGTPATSVNAQTFATNGYEYFRKAKIPEDVPWK